MKVRREGRSRSDCRWWSLVGLEQSDPELKSSVKKYVELDFDEITSRKAAFIKKSKVLSDVLGPSVTIGELSFSHPTKPGNFSEPLVRSFFRREIRNPPSISHLLPPPSRPSQSPPFRPHRSFPTNSLGRRVSPRLPRSISQRRLGQVVRGEVRRLGWRNRVRDDWAEVSSELEIATPEPSSDLYLPSLSIVIPSGKY